jgi:L-lactate dehydrogenase (cytochrome)
LCNLVFCSKIFAPIHPKGIIERTLKPEAFIGFVDPSTLPDDAELELTEDEQRVEEARASMPPLEAMVNLHDFEVRGVSSWFLRQLVNWY